jgi:hypothetical protein
MDERMAWYGNDMDGGPHQRLGAGPALRPWRSDRTGPSVGLLVLLGLILLFPGLVVGQASAPDHLRSHGGEGREQTPVTGYCLAVIVDGQQVASLTIDDLKALPLVEDVLQEGSKPQNGPTLKSVLAKVGITKFRQLTVAGFAKGRVATAEITLTSAQVHDRVLFDLTRRGTAKLASPELAFDDWIVDVAKVIVEVQ